ncbi:MAG: polysaccharide biosynthesis/export family protein [Acidobacteria bacterium]|nr:polysaccharide biosynthesis/export family protein [Acidobacteriota bacterium]
MRVAIAILVVSMGLAAPGAVLAQDVPTPAAPELPAGAGELPLAVPDGVLPEPFYKLQPSDVVTVKYRYTPEYDATVSVRPDGFITLPIVGDVKVSGLTVADAQRAIRTAAAARLRDPELTFELKDFQKPRFVVGGEVDKPGQFELRGRISLLEAIAMAGGFKSSAKHSQVVLFRRFDETQVVTRVINAKELAKASRVEEDPYLRSGDFLFVPQNKISKLERLVPLTSIGWLLAWAR